MLPKECDGRVTSGPTRRVCTQKGILEARRRSFAGGALATRLGGRIANAAALLGAFDVKAFGAKGDGKTIDSPAIHKAIEAAVAAGGGTVSFAVCNYLCFSIRLKSNVGFFLRHSAS